MDSTCLWLDSQWSGGSRDLVDIGWSTGLRTVSGFWASAGLWVVGWALGFQLGYGQSGGYWVSRVMGLPGDSGVLFGFWVLIFTDGRPVWGVFSMCLLTLMK